MFLKTVAEKHGMAGTHPYSKWANMMQRCYNPNVPNYCNYGGRGITVCDEWHEFKNWYNDMWSTYEDGLLLDRIDNEKPYSKDNCRWTTMIEQHKNKRNNIWYRYKGEPIIQKDLLRLLDLNHTTMYLRKKKGWELHRVFGVEKGSISRLVS